MPLRAQSPQRLQDKPLQIQDRNVQKLLRNGILPVSCEVPVRSRPARTNKLPTHCEKSISN